MPYGGDWICLLFIVSSALTSSHRPEKDSDAEHRSSTISRDTGQGKNFASNASGGTLFNHGKDRLANDDSGSSSGVSLAETQPFSNSQNPNVIDSDTGEPLDEHDVFDGVDMPAIGDLMCCSCWEPDYSGGERWYSESTRDSWGVVGSRDSNRKPVPCRYGEHEKVCAKDGYAILAWGAKWVEGEKVEPKCREMWKQCLDDNVVEVSWPRANYYWPSAISKCLRDEDQHLFDPPASNVGAFCSHEKFKLSQPNKIHSYLGKSRTCTFPDHAVFQQAEPEPEPQQQQQQQQQPDQSQVPRASSPRLYYPAVALCVLLPVAFVLS